MDEQRFRSYEGREPYVFISYAHKDTQIVVPLLQRLKYAPGKRAGAPVAGRPPQRLVRRGRSLQRCYRIWYDEGIDAATEWPANVERHMNHAAQIIVFWSDAASRSRNCSREMRQASESGRPVLFIRLDDTPLKASDAGAHPVIDARDASSAEAIVEKILAGEYLISELIGPEYPRPPAPPWRLIVSLSALAIGVVAGAVYITRVQPQEALPAAAFVTPAPTETPLATAAPVGQKDLAAFTNPLIEDYVYETLHRYDLMPLTIHDAVLKRAIYDRLGLDESAQAPDAAALSGITELHICGDTVAESRDAIRVADGAYTVDGEAVRRGALQFRDADDAQSDYHAIVCMSELTSLSLCYQSQGGETFPGGQDIGSLAALRKLTYLDISGNPSLSSENFGYLKNNRQLTELNIAHTRIPTVITLLMLPSLETVYVSRDMLPDMARHAFDASDSRIRFDVVVID